MAIYQDICDIHYQRGYKEGYDRAQKESADEITRLRDALHVEEQVREQLEEDVTAAALRQRWRSVKDDPPPDGTLTLYRWRQNGMHYVVKTHCCVFDEFIYETEWMEIPE